MFTANLTPTQSVTAYCERTLVDQRTFELLPDRLIVRVKNALVRSGERTIMLKDLNPDPERGVLRARDNVSLVGFFLALFVLVVVAGYIDWRQTDSAWFSIPSVVIALGILFFLFYRRKIEYRLFSYKSGAVAFDVMQRGRHRASFAPFVQTLEKAIKTAA